MTPKQRMAAIAQGIKPDRIPFLPTIIEHSAYIIGQTPSQVAQDTGLIAAAHIQAYKLYHPDSITIGIDIYNIEAEALGCQVRFYNDASIPGIVSRPLTHESATSIKTFSENMGRIQTMLTAATAVKQAVGDEVSVNIGICGPFSILMELMGFEAAIEGFYDDEAKIHKLLEALLAFQKSYATTIAACGLGVVVFESWASPPLVSPEIYRQYAFPYEAALIAHIKSLGLPSCPLVIGGDTSHIVDDIIQTGTTLLVADYNAPLQLYVKKARQKNITVRANIDPKQVQNGDWSNIKKRVQEIQNQVDVYPKIVAGTGVIPYNTPPENLQRVKELLTQQ